MRVGLNLLFLDDGAGGVGRYATELAGALTDRSDVELELFLNDAGLTVLSGEPWLGRARVTRVRASRENRLAYLAATFGVVPAMASAHRLDILHSPANVGPVISPGVKCVITAHDLIWMRVGDQWGSPEEIEAMRRATKLTVPRAARVVTVSEASARDLDEIGVSRNRIDVVHHGVRIPVEVEATPESQLRERLGLGDGRVILCVAQKRPYKGQDKLVRALPDLPVDVRLVLPGGSTQFEEDLSALARKLGVEDRVVMPDWLSEADLEGLYGLSTCFALASEIEGFGMPVLEAMARGLPVACSNRPSLPEVAGDATVLFDPDDQSSVTSALVGILGDQGLRVDLAERGIRRASEFTWRRAAEQTVDAYRRALGEGIVGSR